MIILQPSLIPGLAAPPNSTTRMSQPLQMLMSHKSVDWHTPPEFTDAARGVMGHIDLDPASSKIANETVKAKKFYTINDNGLNRSWSGNVWLNPPYSKTRGRSNQEIWASKLVHEYNTGRVTSAILLVKSAFGYNWFENLFKSWPACLASKRISFLLPGTTPGPGPAKHATTFYYFGDNLDRFIEVFGVWGNCTDPKTGHFWAMGTKRTCPDCHFGIADRRVERFLRE